MNYVVGSGPSGVMCAHAILAQGEPVTVLDVGRVADPEVLETARLLRQTDPDEWDPALVQKIKGGGDLVTAKLKPAFGSAFPYAFDALRAIEQENTKCTWSFARGGLSNVWGAGMLPYDAEDLRDWPVGTHELEPHYRVVAGLAKIAGTPDDLEKIFPFFRAPEPPLGLSRQARLLLDRWSRHGDALRASGYLFGRSRLAVRTTDGELPGCRYCGLCLSGCPYFAIYNSSETLDQLSRRAKFSYRKGLRVLRIEERDCGVTVVCQRTDDSKEIRLDGRRVFLAGGILSTLQLVLDSLEVSEVTLTMAYPPYLVVPMLSVFDTAAPQKERLHTLSQLFLQLRKPAISPYRIHLSLYTYNELMKERLGRALRGLSPIAPLAERAFLGRLVGVQGFFSSRVATGIRVRACRAPGEPAMRIRLEGQDDPEVNTAMRRLVRNLVANAPRLGLLPIVPAVERGVPGEGNHSGGTFPMSANPSGFQTDRLGRLSHFRSIHIVDSSVFPSVSSGSPTYTIMANAYRIGTEALKPGA